MEPNQIVKQMVDLKSVYGIGARMCLGDPELEKKFIYECYDSIQEDKKSMERAFSAEIVDQIISFVKNSQEPKQP